MFVLFACADSSDSSDAADSAPAAELTLAPPDNGVQLEVGPVPLDPGGEEYWCKTMLLPNDEPLDVIGLAHESTPGAHHFNIWGLLAGPEDAEGPCDEVWAEANMQVGTPLYGSQTLSFAGEFPDGVAAQLPTGLVVLMELHAINTTSEPIEVSGRFNATAAAPGADLIYANAIYGNARDIELAPHSETIVETQCFIEHDVEVFVLGSHAHARLTAFDIYAMDTSGVRGEQLYESTDWTSPLLDIRSDDPVPIAAGAGLSWACQYTNDSDATITYGEGVDDEMCMMVGIYYPDHGFLQCGG